MNTVIRRSTASRSMLALSLAVLAGSSALAAQPTPQLQPRTLTVSGEGEVKAAPDEAQLSAGVVSQATTAEAALAANRTAMNGVFDELKHQGIPDKSIQTSEFSVSPQYETGDNPRRIVGYSVSNNVTVTVDDLSKLGGAIDALVHSGANSMGGVSFTLRDPKPLMQKAREAAVKDAMERAQTYARAAGLTLGRVTDLNEGGGGPIERPMFRTMAVMAAAPPPTPIAAGEETVSANVSMTFEIR